MTPPGVPGEIEEVGARLLAFLRPHPGRWFCDDCLQRRFHVPDGAVRDAIERLVGGPAIIVRVGDCSECSQLRSVVRAADAR